jgi:predicted nucleic acid-binding protein
MEPMIVLDTNVLSEALKPSPDERVLRWLSAQDRDLVYTTAITQAEILYGVELLATGKRLTRLQDAVERLFSEEFHERILPFDGEAALVYPKIVAGRDAMGRPISQFDAVIASICRSRNAAVATRNTADFEQCGVTILNPWSAA